nr:serine protease [Actinomycetota bacterium]
MRRTLLALAASLALLVAGVPGADPAAAITGGDEADDGEWPWQVAMFVGDEQWCGGSLLTYEIVLTAAHCTDGLGVSDIEVFAGSVDLSDRDTGQQRGVEAIRQHEDYDAAEIRNDIAILVLDEPFDEADGVEPVSLPDPDTAARL